MNEPPSNLPIESHVEVLHTFDVNIIILYVHTCEGGDKKLSFAGSKLQLDNYEYDQWKRIAKMPYGAKMRKH